MKKLILICSLFLFVHGNVNGQTFSIISDFGSNDTNQLKVSKLVNSMNPEFVITAGDNFHKVLTPLDSMIKKYYGRFYNVRTFYPVSGNHDFTDPVNYYLTPENYALNYIDYFSYLPGNRRYYTFTKGDIQFFMYNSDFGGIYSYCPNERKIFEPHGIDSNSIQGQWLKSELNRSNAKMKIIVTHYPPYFSFPYDYDTTTVVNCNGTPYRLNVEVDTLFKKLRMPFEKWGADLIISGHTHCGEHLKVDSLDYWIQLSGGAPLGNWFANRNVHSKFFYKSEFGATLAKFANNELKLKLVNVRNDTVYSLSVIPKKAMRLKVKVKAGQDSITANLRSANLPYHIISSDKRKLANNEAVFYFKNAELGKNYFLEVKHRNSISVWTQTSLTANLDLTNPANVTGSNLDGNGYLYSGDVDSSGFIEATDAQLIDNDAKLFKSGYLNTDLNGNNFIDVSDLVECESNITKFVSEVRP